MRYIYKAIIKENLNKLQDDYIVLKSNGYGFGLDYLLKILQDYPFFKFACIDLATAIKIRATIPTARILLLGVFERALIDEYLKYNIELSINNIAELYLLEGRNIPLQLCINSGMNRFGLNINELAKIKESETKYNFVGIYSHNATLEAKEITKQIAYLAKCIALFPNLEVHFQASSIASMPMPFKACKRIGNNIFANAMEIKGKVIFTRYVYKGECIGYDYYTKMTKNGFIAIVDLGYADGLVRKNSGYMVLIRGKKYPFISKACMNHSFLLVDQSVSPGDTVTVISNELPLEDYAKYFGISLHECYISFSLSKTIYQDN